MSQYAGALAGPGRLTWPRAGMGAAVSGAALARSAGFMIGETFRLVES